MTHIQTRDLLESLFFPPGIIILLIALVLLTATIKPRFFSKLLFYAMFLLWLFSMPAFSYWITDWLQNQYPALNKIPPGADVIVALGAGQTRGENEFGNRAMLGGEALQRARYAGYLAKKSGLPVIVTGAAPRDHALSHARLMQEFLTRDMGVRRVLIEDQSTTTFENARYIADLMRRHGFKKAVLVTHAWHMPRAVDAFRFFDISVYPAPTARARPDTTETGYYAWLPSARALRQSEITLHELVGRLYYRFEYYTSRAQEYPIHGARLFADSGVAKT
ncbi:MAG TPA: YdcF family protein [Gammaproteobacteria bacterium]|nr:YdcF family protein [Gammaproteobacteria bacterium]